MSEQQKNQAKQNLTSDDSYSFYWNYNDQLAHDNKEKEKKKVKRKKNTLKNIGGHTSSA